MATATEVRYTPEDLLKIDDRPMPELVNGQLVERAMGQRSDEVAAVFLFFIAQFIREHKLGRFNGASAGYQIFPDDPDKVRIPDASYTRIDRLKAGVSAIGHSRIAPDLVIEVISPNDTGEAIEEKINDYFAAGVPLIWVAYPESRVVQVHRKDGSGTRLTTADTLSGEDILPGFALPIAEVFA
jgi:Uma2 family endonuclease